MSALRLSWSAWSVARSWSVASALEQNERARSRASRKKKEGGGEQESGEASSGPGVPPSAFIALPHNQGRKKIIFLSAFDLHTFLI